MLNLANIDNVGLADSPIDASENISARIIQWEPVIVRHFFRYCFSLGADPCAPEDTGSTMSCVEISGVLNN